MGVLTTAHNNETPAEFTNRTPFIRCISKVDATTIDDAADLDLVMSMHILIEYSSNYSRATGTLWFY